MTATSDPRPTPIVQAESPQSEVRPLPTAPVEAHVASVERELPTGPGPVAALTPAATPMPVVAELSGTEHRKIFWEALSAGAIGKVIGTGIVKFLEKVL